MEGTENIIYLTGISRVFKIKILMGQVKSKASGIAVALFQKNLTDIQFSF